MNTHTAHPDQHLDAVVIGAGQAGLAAGYHLKRQGAKFIIVDSNDRVGDNWRCRWDSLRLYTPAGYDGLPGLDFPADRHSYPTKDGMADYLEDYAARFDLPVCHGSPVRRVTPSGQGYVVELSDGRYEADNVVVATGTFGRSPRIPVVGADLKPEIVQLHSGEYVNPGQLRDGKVLVVGASHSGADIAFEVARSHETVLCGPDTGRIPVRPESLLFRVVFPIMWQVWGHIESVRTPIGRKARAYVHTHGAPLLRVTNSDLEGAGVKRVVERMTGVLAGLPVLGEDQLADVANVIWCTGFHHDFSWIDVPVIGDDGWPMEERGAVPSAPGLYFTGLSFQSSFRSMLIGGAGADASYVVNHLLTRPHADRSASEEAA